MVRTSFSGREIVSVLTNHGYRPVDRPGNHLKLRYEHPDTGEVRVVTVPIKSADRIPTGTLQSIADYCGAKDFRAWYDPGCKHKVALELSAARPC